MAVQSFRGSAGAYGCVIRDMNDIDCTDFYGECAAPGPASLCERKMMDTVICILGIGIFFAEQSLS